VQSNNWTGAVIADSSCRQNKALPTEAGQGSILRGIIRASQTKEAR